MNLFSFNIPDWIFVAFNLIILVVVLKKILWSRVIKIMDERQAEAEKAAEYAVLTITGHEEMERRREEFENEFQNQITVQMQDARRRAGAEYDRIVAEAETKARQIVSAAHTQAERMTEIQLNEARHEIIASVLSMTGMLLETEMTSERNERFVASLLDGKQA